MYVTNSDLNCMLTMLHRKKKFTVEVSSLEPH
jgi:hypothetical protein